MKAMLATSIVKIDDRPEAPMRLALDDRWLAQSKANGKRLLLVLEDGHVAGLNRDGIPTSFPDSVKRVFEGFAGRFVFDGELVGRQFLCFDMPIGGQHVDVATPLAERLDVLRRLFDLWQPGDAVQLLPTYTTAKAKKDLLRRVLIEGGEGVMFKTVNSPYVPCLRRSDRSRLWIKAKNLRHVSCVVTELGRDGKANLVVAVIDADGNEVECGEVTALAGHGPRIKVGDIIDVEILNVSEAGRLYQPTMPKIRTDLKREDCSIDQLDEHRIVKEILA